MKLLANKSFQPSKQYFSTAKPVLQKNSQEIHLPSSKKTVPSFSGSGKPKTIISMLSAMMIGLASQGSAKAEKLVAHGHHRHDCIPLRLPPVIKCWTKCFDFWLPDGDSVLICEKQCRVITPRHHHRHHHKPPCPERNRWRF